MFIAVFSVAKKLKCLSTEKQINKMWYIQTFNGTLFSNKKRMAHATIQQNLENVMVSERRQSTKDYILCDFYFHEMSKKKANP